MYNMLTGGILYNYINSPTIPGLNGNQRQLGGHVYKYEALKVRLWVLMRDQTLTHLCVDISLIP